MVIGFKGGEFNSVGNYHHVLQKHAHAWVEAYLRPEDCTQEMIDMGQAGPGGAWMILDPTPISPDNNNGRGGNNGAEPSL